MTVTEITLFSLVSWLLLLVIALGIYRVPFILTGKRTASSFNSAGPDEPGFSQRLTRAHANCYENLAASAAVLLYAIFAQKTAITDDLAYVFLGARIAQSVTHIISTSLIAVIIRFTFYVVQILILCFWIMRLIGHF